MATIYEPPPTAYEVMSQVARWIALADRVKITFTIDDGKGEKITETINRIPGDAG